MTKKIYQTLAVLLITVLLTVSGIKQHNTEYNSVSADKDIAEVTDAVGSLTDADKAVNGSAENTGLTDENGESLGLTVETGEDTGLADEPGEPLSESAAEAEEADEESDSLPKMRKVKGIYVTGPVAGTSAMDDLIKLVDDTELNAMVIDVKNDEGKFTYDISLDGAEEMDAYTHFVSDMPGLIEKLHEHDIYVIARIICFKDPTLAACSPELALLTPDGEPVQDANGLSWVNPYRNEVWDYLCRVAEQAHADGFDEIQFDYVRFPVGDVAAAADYGVDTAAYSREEGLGDFFEYVSQRLHSEGIVFGADLFGTVIGSEVDRDITGQDYADIAGMADCVCPMVYPSHYGTGSFGFDVPDAHPYDTVLGALEKSAEVINEAGIADTAVVRPWLQCFNATWVSGHIDYDAETIAEEIRAVYDAGYDEYILWNATCRYTQAFDNN